MNSGENPVQPLVADPKREAINSARGLIYQYWQTIWRWICLDAGEVLFIEKAEDFDVISGANAETTQVKDTAQSGRVTLNSVDVLDAISNFWQLKQKNKEFKIDFRFLTTAERGQEKQKNFGEEKGLDLWDECKFNESKLGSLREFLQRKSNLPSSLIHFLQTASDQQLQEELVQRVTWETGSRSIATVKRLIIEQVSCFAEKKGIPRAFAIRVVAQLFQFVCDLIAEQGERRLHRDDYLRIFEEELQARPEFTSFSPVSHVAKPSFEAQVKLVPPRLVNGVSQRRELLLSLIPVLKSERVLFLKGSTGMGKSTLANFIVRETKWNCKWIDLRGLAGDEIRLLLHHETFSPAIQPGAIHVLDDLTCTGGFATYENALVDFCYAVLSKGATLIITSQSDLPQSILTQIDQNRDIEFSVPPLEDSEIEEVISNFGCPHEEDKKAWTLFVRANTHGHPQLVLAAAKNLEAAGWPKPFSTSSQKPTDLAEVRKDARRLLRDTLPSDAARTLAFRLSLLDKPFRRDHAFSIAGHQPGIQLPGEAFEILVGPWIEQIDDTYFRISPLLYGAATEIWSSEDVIRIQRTIAEGVLSCGKLTYLEAAIVLQNGLDSGAEGAVTVIGSQLVKLRSRDLSEMIPYFTWFLPMKLGEAEVLFPQNVVLSGMLRVTQFEMAYRVSPTRLALAVAKKWEEELVKTGNAEMDNLMRVGFLLETIVCHEAPFPISILVDRVVEVLPLLEKTDVKSFFSNKILPTGEAIELTESMFSFVLARVNSAQDALTLFNALANLPEEKRLPLLNVLEQHERWATLLCGKIYLTEEGKQSPKWDFCITTLQLLATTCSAWKMQLLTASCYSAMAVIHDEYLSDSAVALKTLDKAKRVLGEHPLLENQRAMILFRQNRYGEALQIFRQILPQWKCTTVTIAFATHKAEICAAHLGDWESAARFALDGEKTCSTQQLANMALGFTADYAWACWKLGKYAESLKVFSSVLEALPAAPDPESNFRAYALHRQLGHAIAFILRSTKITGDLPPLLEPPPGWFSLAEVNERIKDDPLRPLDYVFMLLAQVESETTNDDTVLTQLERRAARTDFASVRFGASTLRLRHSLKARKWSCLINEYIASMDQFASAVENFSRESFGPINQDERTRIAQLTAPKGDHVHLGDLLFAAVVIEFSASRQFPNFAVWRTQIESHPDWRNSEGITAWLDFATTAKPVSFADLRAKIDGRNFLWSVGSFFLSLNPDLTVDDQLLANMILVDAAAHSNWRNDIEATVERVIVEAWTKIALDARFNLVSPAANAPRILNAVTSTHGGLRKAAEVLWIAKDAVRVSPPQNLVDEIARLRI